MANAGQELAESKTEYEALMGRLGYSMIDGEGSRLRQNPRFQFDTPERTILIQIQDSQCALNDISLGGLSFFASRDFGAGNELQLNFDGRFDARVKVVRVALDEKMSSGGTKFYFHGTSFLEEAESYRCTVLVLKYLSEIMEA